MKKNIKTDLNVLRNDIINILKKYYLIMICFFIVIAFMRLFLLLKEYNYTAIIAYGEKVTVLIGALAGLTFTYASTFENSEKKAVREIGERFLMSFLYFVIGLILSIGVIEPLSKPSDLLVFPGIFLNILGSLSLIIMLILFLIGFIIIIISAVYLGIGIDDLTKWLLKNKK